MMISRLQLRTSLDRHCLEPFHPSLGRPSNRFPTAWANVRLGNGKLLAFFCDVFEVTEGSPQCPCLLRHYYLPGAGGGAHLFPELDGLLGRAGALTLGKVPSAAGLPISLPQSGDGDGSVSAPTATLPCLHFFVEVRPTQRGGVTQTLVDLNQTFIWIREKRMVASKKWVRNLPCHPLLGFLACDCGTSIPLHLTWSCLGKSAILQAFPLQEVSEPAS